MKWSAIITTFNSEEVIAKALNSLLNLTTEEQPAKIIVVDNASNDNTVQILKTFKEKITLILNKNNLGLSKANNIGASKTDTPYLFFLNPDIELLPGAITALHTSAIANPTAALIGPAMFNEKDEQQSTARTWPTPLIIAARRTFIRNTEYAKKIISTHLDKFNSKNQTTFPHWLVGAAILLTPKGKDTVGLMSEDYFLYFEDVEWCWRTWKRKMIVVFEPKAKIKHVCHRESTKSTIALKFHLKSMLKFYFTHTKMFLGYKPGEYK